MNDTMSLLLATAILAAGGLGLYMYKSDDHQKGGEDYNEDNLFGSGSFWGSTNEEDDNVEHDDEDYEDYEEYYKPKPRGGKTKRRRATGGTKRRY
jgi:hypothetical protein